ncbi:hypothetical protein JB92DRAFT_3124007 [Gautieria morchelliformis]|nr:hypothetical protein JB92DRAFT_3124007 [Gautieria morchelliformis]
MSRPSTVPPMSVSNLLKLSAALSLTMSSSTTPVGPACSGTCGSYWIWEKKEAQEEVPLGRRKRESRSLASEILKKRKVEERHKENIYSPLYLFMRMGRINRETWNWYSISTCFAIMTGMVYPAFGIVYGGLVSITPF